MSTAPAAKPLAVPRRGLLIAVALGLVVLAAIAFDTTVVHIGSEQDARQQAFSPDKYGEDQFARIQTFVDGKAVDAVTLGTELLADKAGTAKKYGTASSTGAIIPVKLTGVDTSALTGKTVEVTGAFRLINPKNWLITPVRLAVK
jgi:predicted lipoprotein